jgi:riboflavin kinase
MGEERKIERFKGKLTFGMLRGGQLIKKFQHRLTGILGYEPFPGTLDIKLEKPININNYETKRIEHILMDGSSHVDAKLAPIRLIVERDGNEEKYNCWVIRQYKNIHDDDIIEVLTKDNVKKKFGITEGDDVEIEMTRIPLKKYEQFRSKVKSFVLRENKKK